MVLQVHGKGAIAGRQRRQIFRTQSAKSSAPLRIFDFHPHEINGQIAPVNFGETDGVLLGGDNDLGLALFAAVDDVEDFLLGETVVIGEPLGIDQFGAQLEEALLEAFRWAMPLIEATRLPFTKSRPICSPVKTSSK